jgi:hypothetical protein
MPIVSFQKTWDIALGPFKQIPMNLFIMYMAGSSISIFPIMMVGMMFLRPVKALLAIKSSELKLFHICHHQNMMIMVYRPFAGNLRTGVRNNRRDTKSTPVQSCLQRVYSVLASTKWEGALPSRFSVKTWKANNKYICITLTMAELRQFARCHEP